MEREHSLVRVPVTVCCTCIDTPRGQHDHMSAAEGVWGKLQKTLLCVKTVLEARPRNSTSPFKSVHLLCRCHRSIQNMSDVDEVVIRIRR
jgi:hypothetical protein